MQKLVINIDDFGMSDETDRRILSLLDLKYANSVSVFVNEDYKNSFKQLTKYSHSTDIGVHLFHDFSDPSYSSKEILGCFEEQINRALSTNTSISHIDNHRPEVYLHPDVFLGVIDLAAKFELFLRYPMVGFDDSMCSLLSKKYHIRPNKIISLHSAYYERIKIKNVKHLSGLYGAEGQELHPKDFFHFTSQKNPKHLEILSHAGNSHEHYKNEIGFLKSILDHPNTKLLRRQESY